MTEAEKAYQYFVIAVPENEEQAKAYFWARKVLQLTLNPPNEPLTLEQLREMDGEPVYIIAGDMGISEWNVIKGKGYITLAYDQPTIGFKAVKEGIEFINGRTFSIDSYGVTWLAYRRPPANAGSDPDPVGKGSWADSSLL